MCEVCVVYVYTVVCKMWCVVCMCIWCVVYVRGVLVWYGVCCVVCCVCPWCVSVVWHVLCGVNHHLSHNISVLFVPPQTAG